MQSLDVDVMDGGVLRGASLGKQLRDDGMKKALEAERRLWVEQAMLTLLRYSKQEREFTADMFRRHWEFSGGAEPHSPNVWGALFHAAAKRNYIRDSGRMATSASPQSRARRCVVWERVTTSG